MLTHADRLVVIEAVWPGTAARGVHEVNRRLITIYDVEAGKDSGAPVAEVERARELLLEGMADKETGR